MSAVFAEDLHADDQAVALEPLEYVYPLQQFLCFVLFLSQMSCSSRVCGGGVIARVSVVFSPPVRAKVFPFCQPIDRAPLTRRWKI
jgi:hypothetical protein